MNSGASQEIPPPVGGATQADTTSRVASLGNWALVFEGGLNDLLCVCKCVMCVCVWGGGGGGGYVEYVVQVCFNLLDGTLLDSTVPLSSERLTN